MFTLVPQSQHSKGLFLMAGGGFSITIHNNVKIRPEYVLGLLNSKLLFWKLRSLSNDFRGGWITCTKQYFGELPIRNIDFNDKQQANQHDYIVSLVTRLIDLYSIIETATTTEDQKSDQRNIDSLESELDALVYKLYGLTPEEIQIVESV